VRTSDAEKRWPSSLSSSPGEMSANAGMPWVDLTLRRRVMAYWPDASDSQPSEPSSNHRYHSFQKPSSKRIWMRPIRSKRLPSNWPAAPRHSGE